VKHMNRLVDDLLDVYQITQGTVSLEKEPIELVAFVREAFQGHQRALQATGIQFALELPTRSVRVHADRLRLAQVLAHLIQNAVKFCSSGDRVVVRVVANGNWARLIVRDN